MKTEKIDLPKELTLRDYFAAAAVQGFSSATNIDLIHKQWATAAYKVADAMLAERAKS